MIMYIDTIEHNLNTIKVENNADKIVPQITVLPPKLEEKPKNNKYNVVDWNV